MFRLALSNPSKQSQKEIKPTISSHSVIEKNIAEGVVDVCVLFSGFIAYTSHDGKDNNLMILDPETLEKISSLPISHDKQDKWSLHELSLDRLAVFKGNSLLIIDISQIHSPRIIQSTALKENFICSVDYLDDSFSYMLLGTFDGIQVFSGNDLSYLKNLTTNFPVTLRKISPYWFIKSISAINNEIIKIEPSLTLSIPENYHYLTSYNIQINNALSNNSKPILMMKDMLVYQDDKLNLCKSHLIKRISENNFFHPKTFLEPIWHFQAITDDHFVLFTEKSLELWSLDPFTKQSSIDLTDKAKEIYMLPNGLFFYQTPKVFGILNFPAVDDLFIKPLKQKLHHEVEAALPDGAHVVTPIITSYVGLNLFSYKNALEEKLNLKENDRSVKVTSEKTLLL